MHIDLNYHQLLEIILKDGYEYEDPNRTGVVRKEIKEYTFRHSFEDGFPVITTKKLFFKAVVTELIWFLSGDTNINYLVVNGCNIWNTDAYNYYLRNLEKGKTPHTFERFIELVKSLNMPYINSNRKGYELGDLGPIYGHQWVMATKAVAVGGGHVRYLHLNQIRQLITRMIDTPMSSELIVEAWNPIDVGLSALPPCHKGFQVVMKPIGDGKYGFTLIWDQRSVDTFLGLPFNISSYATLALILESVTGHKALGIQGNLKKVHLYDNSFSAVEEQLGRIASEEKATLDLEGVYGQLSEMEPKDSSFYADFVRTLYNNRETLMLRNYIPQKAISVKMLGRD